MRMTSVVMAATYPVNAAGATEVGIWVFSARTGTLTAAWNEHTICCALSGTDFPHILWVSPHGTLLIASGMSTQNQGRSCSYATPTARCSSFHGRA